MVAHQVGTYAAHNVRTYTFTAAHHQRTLNCSELNSSILHAGLVTSGYSNSTQSLFIMVKQLTRRARRGPSLTNLGVKWQLGQRLQIHLSGDDDIGGTFGCVLLALARAAESDWSVSCLS